MIQMIAVILLLKYLRMSTTHSGNLLIGFDLSDPKLQSKLFHSSNIRCEHVEFCANGSKNHREIKQWKSQIL